MQEEYLNKTVFLSGDNIGDKRQEIKKYFNDTTVVYEKLFEVIKNENSFYSKPEPLRHPLIFYFGHTATFFINKLIFGRFINDRLNDYYESTFAIGVDEMSWDDLNQDHYDWPCVSDVKQYRNEVKKIVNNLIDNMPLSLPIKQNTLAWTILMGIEHERIHLETSAVIIRMLPINQVQKHSFFRDCRESGSAPKNKLIPLKGKEVYLGKKENDFTYGWDVEYGTQKELLDDFSTSKYLVSNQEYLEFMNGNGYLDTGYWSEEGVNWLKFSKRLYPIFWIKKNNVFYLRNLTSEIKLPLNWPVEINYLEAEAFCNWKSKLLNKNVTLPSEAQWYLLRENIKDDLLNWKSAPGNINLEHFASSCPVDKFEANGFFDIIGNVWQWTKTPIKGFNGFKVDPLYDDFSVPTFDGKHNLIKGGSWISTGNESLKSARYAFRKHFYQFAGLRYIVEEKKMNIEDNNKNIYESDDLISQYLGFHYGPDHFEVENFPMNCISKSLELINLDSKEKCLDLGCSVGRSSFELAAYFDKVDAIDFSARFISAAASLQEDSELSFCSRVEGDITFKHSIHLNELNLEKFAKKVNFSQGDACNLKSTFTNYDLVFCGNLIDRLYDPALFLKGISNRINQNGFLILTSPYTWLEEYTPKDKWIGGYFESNKEVLTIDGLKKILETKFDFVESLDIPFCIKETARKYQHSIAEMSIWQKC